MRDALELVRRRLVGVIDALATFAEKYRDLPCLGFTHLQPAQPTTVGKRACLWAYDLVMDLGELDFRASQLKARGAKGTTGTQASFLQLLGGDHNKVRRLDQLVAEKMGFPMSYIVTGQTYSRKVDAQVLGALAGIATSAHKAATDLRLLQNRKEIEEPFETEQIGSSAMAYKRNPMRAERICGLGRFVISLESSAANTAATQWLERTLDDSANRRLTIPQAFLAVDAILMLYQNIASGLVVYPHVIAKHLHEELPFMATEAILMEAVAKGGDRQDVHESIRRHSQDAADRVKKEGGDNDLLKRLAADPVFKGIDLAATLDPARFVGRAPEQVEEFISDVVAPIRARFAKDAKLKADIRV
jgi:adenylosuccinate lyase